MPYMLRLKTYLSPNMPKELYEHIVKYLNKKLNTKIQLILESQHEGPDRNKPDPFSLNQIDIGHFHLPFYIWLLQKKPSPVELLPVAPIFTDPRAQGKPIYFADVIVKRGRFLDTFDDLKNKQWGYGKVGSISSYYSILKKLQDINETPSSFFTKTSAQEDQLTIINNVRSGLIDAAAVDSNVLALQHKKDRSLKHHVKIIESWGPFPLQPFVIRKGFDKTLKQDIGSALKEMPQFDEHKHVLSHYLIEGFGDVCDKDFDRGKALLKSCEGMCF